MSMLLAGDVGGTKTTLGLFQLGEDPKAPRMEATFPSAKYPDLETIVHEFLAESPMSVKYAAFGVAGPVIEGEAKITNLPWALEEKAMASALHLSEVRLINDLEALATGVPFLPPSDLATLNPGRPDPRGPIAVVAPGTGLGEAFITMEGSRYRVHPSEGGHSDFAPADGIQAGLLAYLLERFDHVSYEEVCSGLGILNIHAYIEKTSAPEPPEWRAKELAAEDPVPLIAEDALREHPECDTSLPTLDMFASILGAEAGNLALKVLATGGVYLGGGIPRKILPLLQRGSFVKSFARKGRMSQLISRIPVHVILNPRTPLLGAARFGIEQTMRRTPVPGISTEVRASP
jgi:glucokinase